MTAASRGTCGRSPVGDGDGRDSAFSPRGGDHLEKVVPIHLSSMLNTYWTVHKAKSNPSPCRKSHRRSLPKSSRSPATLQANIEGVARHFRKYGLTIDDYLRAAVKQPPLLHESAATVSQSCEKYSSPRED